MAVASWYICTGLIGKREAEGARLETDCVRYVSKAIPAILGHWKFPEWKKRATPELMNSVNLKKEARRFREFRQIFGELRKVGEPMGTVVSDDKAGYLEINGFYTVPLRFQRGNADLSVRLVKRGGGWKFQKFSLRSDSIDPTVLDE